MLTKTQAIVLHAIKYGETRLIVDMFTKVFGRQAFIVSIPKTPKGKVKKQFFQPLTILEIETDIRPRQQLQKLHDVRLAAPFASIPFEPDKLAISLFVAEFLYYALRSEQRNELLYEYLENSIVWLDGQQSSFANFHLVFLLRLTRFLGFYPNLDDYKDGDYFDLRESVFMPMPPVHRDFLHPEEAQKVQLMMRMDFPTMHLFRMSHQERNRLLEVSLKYYRLHLPDFPEMKSIEVLQALYQ
ncbi:MAG: DNA repair protein RecO [Prevotella sp.]|jgi:DNA repair protein RecO (recombination protein O)|uniref:DNA repair protein RecO n=1 Tax=Prevotellaceae TaxID=171552 RepID=UPI00051C4E5D|nr:MULTISPECIES: DNA repair protein RecO [Prevotellaceae]MBO4896645.1 DNA repair protein RecO [Prevotella sp.]MBP3246313.1 DNA repair protein RecO [Prevotella sp.]MBQ3313761.1 DNA repair protein RecO [Prevotella sp.]MBQ4413012.1 DNA repair protein RecO [Prevotella sp.]MBQ6055977.1 DNA repair protein RecO [Prevotella sp.]